MIDKMRGLLLTLLVIFAFGCSVDSIRTNEENIPTDFGSANVKIIEVDECEYVWVTDYYKGGLTHKGNCKNH